MGKYTKADIKRIANAMRRQRDDKPDRPYSLLTGAGCSKSAGIPLASELVKEIKDKYKLDIDHRLGEDCGDDYGACMSVLSSNEVKDIIQPHLDKAGVNWGHLAIASLIKAEYVGRVLTFNFDSVLARACGLLGEYPATYDFVSSVSTRTDHIAQQAILHLHGQGHSLAILNSAEETKEHAENLRPLLTETFSRAPMIVAGYSGKSDAVFSVIEDIYKGAERLHWTDYPEECGPHITRLLKVRPNASEFLGGADSDLFLMDLARELDCWPPQLFKNPYSHLLEELGPIVKYPGSDADPLSVMKQVLLEKSNETEETEDDASDLIIKGDWDAAEKKLSDIPIDENEKQLLAIALKSKANTICRNGWTNDCTMQELQESRSLFERAYQLDDDFNESYFNSWGNVILGLAKQEKDETLFRESIDKYEEAIRIKPDKHEAFHNWGNALFSLATLKKNENLFRESFDKYEEAIRIKPDKYDSFIGWGSALLELYKLTDDEADLNKAAEKLEKVRKSDSDNLFNYACARALQGNSDSAQEALLHCEQAGTLPNRAHLETDTDLDSLRDEQWFKELLARQA